MSPEMDNGIPQQRFPALPDTVIGGLILGLRPANERRR